MKWLMKVGVVLTIMEWLAKGTPAKTEMYQLLSGKSPSEEDFSASVSETLFILAAIGWMWKVFVKFLNLFNPFR